MNVYPMQRQKIARNIGSRFRDDEESMLFYNGFETSMAEFSGFLNRRNHKKLASDAVAISDDNVMDDKALVTIFRKFGEAFDSGLEGASVMRFYMSDAQPTTNENISREKAFAVEWFASVVKDSLPSSNDSDIIQAVQVAFPQFSVAQRDESNFMNRSMFQIEVLAEQSVLESPVDTAVDVISVAASDNVSDLRVAGKE